MLPFLTMCPAPMGPRDARLAADLEAALHEARYKQSAAALDMELGVGHCCEQIQSGSVALWRLLRLPPAVWHALLPRLAARFGLRVVSESEWRWLQAGKHLRLALTGESEESRAAEGDKRSA